MPKNHKGKNNPRWKGGKKNYWHTLARKVMKANNVPKRCILCGSTKTLEVHHKNEDIRDCRLENLEYECLKCHHFKTHEIHLRLRKRIKTNCDYCGKLIEKIPYNFKRAKHHFCSRSCHYKFERNKMKLKSKLVNFLQFLYDEHAFEYRNYDGIVDLVNVNFEQLAEEFLEQKVYKKK